MVNLSQQRSGYAKGESARAEIKEAALRLMARHGIDNVTVRDIIKETGGKNFGAIAYYFDSKEGLIAEIYLDCTIELDGIRKEMLDALEASGEPISLFKIARIYIDSALEAGRRHGDVQYIRFLASLYQNDRMLLTKLVRDHREATVRGLRLARTLFPEMPGRVFRHRAALMIELLNAAMTTHEWVKRHQQAGHIDSLDEYAIFAEEGFLDTLAEAAVAIMAQGTEYKDPNITPLAQTLATQKGS